MGNLKILLVVGGALAIAAVAFWAGSATRPGNDDAGKRLDSAPPTRRSVTARPPSPERPVPGALKRLVKTAGAVKSEKGMKVAASEKMPTEVPIKNGDVHSALLAVLADLDAGRINEQDAVRRIRQLKGEDDRKFLESLRAMSASTDAAGRIRTLAVIAAAYGSDGSPLVIDLDADPDSPEVAIEAYRTHELVGMVGTGLKDPDKTVRDAAFDVFCSLDGDPAFVLSRQILFGDNHDLKLKLMEATAHTASTYAIGLSIDALGNADESVRMAASKNLAELTGNSFASQDEARDWWETNCDAFMKRVNGSDDMNAVTIEETSFDEETNPEQHQKKE